MRLKKIQEALKTKNIIFTYTEEDNCGSLDFQFRGLRYHIWEFVDGDIWGVETNVYHAGKSEDITGDYEKEISELFESNLFLICIRNYSSTTSSTSIGHAFAQMPQAIHLDAGLPSVFTIRPNGQASAHLPQLVHFFLLII